MSKDIKLNQRKRASLQQATVIIFMGIAAVILLALLTFDTSDPGLFHRNSNHTGDCLNMAGCKGAWLADFLFGLLGYLAFAVPVVLVVLGLTAFRYPKHLRTPANPIGGINTVITMTGALFTLLAGSGLAHMLFVPYPLGIGGGVLGKLVADLLINTFLGEYGSLLLLLSLFLGGITLVADISWAELTEKVGDFILKLFDKAQGVKDKVTESGVPEAAGNGALSVSKDLLKSSRNSVSKMGSLLNKVSALAPNAQDLLRRKNNPLEQDIYDQHDPLFDENPNQNQNRYLAEDEGEDNTEKTYRDSVVDDDVRAAPEAAPVKPSAPRQAKSQAGKKASSVADDTVIPAAVGAAGNSMITLPRLSLLDPPPPARERVTQTKESLNHLSEILIQSLGHYGVKGAEVVARDPGPVITRFELQLPDGTKASKVSGLANDLARNMCVSSVRVVEVIPGRPTIGIEIPNEKRDVVTISEMLESAAFKKSPSPLTLAMGKDIAGNPVVADLARMPHLLVAGTTGSGKSVAVNAMLLSLLYKATPEEVRMILIDPKMLELSSYEGIPHLLTPVVTDMKEAANA
ncbi:MAG: DNA translocase FtsK 4TM domain-containing protein, partial [Thiolinea sp.]